MRGIPREPGSVTCCRAAFCKIDLLHTNSIPTKIRESVVSSGNLITIYYRIKSQSALLPRDVIQLRISLQSRTQGNKISIPHSYYFNFDIKPRQIMLICHGQDMIPQL